MASFPFASRLRRRAVLSVLCLALPGFSSGADALHSRTAVSARPVKDVRITAVEGESWLSHLGTPFILSNMGRVANWGPAPSGDPAKMSFQEGVDADFLLSGADLYRLSCRSCHKANGTGVPPEINSLIGPVQATSALMIRAQMKQRGIDLDAKTVNQLVSQAQVALHARLQNGGEKMPPFRHFAPEELKALQAYLDELAGVPGAESRQIWLLEPSTRVGEHLVKGTCHICHEATGPGQAIAVGTPDAIPSLATLAKDRTSSEVIRKVREGLARPTPMMTSVHGQMPVFSDLTPEEIAAAYSYLVRYPPRP